MGSIDPVSQVGKRLLHISIDEIAQNDPTRAFASLPYDDDDLSKGYEDITFKVYANAINKLAWFIESCLGPSSNFETFAFIGKSDLRYHIMAMAAAKTQYRALFSSHMHSTEAHLNLMEKTDTRALFTASSVEVSDIIAGRPMPHFIIPELDDLLSPNPAKHYPYTKPANLAMNDEFLILHSSGTTGLPKPIPLSHECFARQDNISHASTGIDPVTGQKRRNIQNPGPNSRMLLPFLPFHGICSYVCPPAFVWYNVVYIPGFRHRPLKPTDVFSIIEHANITDSFLSPAVIEDLVERPDAPKYFAKLRTLFFGGAAMHSAAAAFAARYTNLQNQWGVTENGKGIDLETAPEDYEYNAFDLNLSGFRFVPINTDLSSDTCSSTTTTTTTTTTSSSRTSIDSNHSTASIPPAQQIHQLYITPDPKSLKYNGVFTRSSPNPITKQLEPWNTGDLWLPHPNPTLAPFTFRFIGRADDLITFKDGSNFHPTSCELMHAEHPLVRSAVLVGVGHREVVLLLELHDDGALPAAGPGTSDAEEQEQQRQQQQEALLQTLWTESISRVNERTEKNGRVRDLGHVVIVNFLPLEEDNNNNNNNNVGYGRTMERNAKGTIARKATIKKFEDVVRERYVRFGDRRGDIFDRVQ